MMRNFNLTLVLARLSSAEANALAEKSMLSSFQIITCSFIVEFCRSRRAKSLLASVALASCALVSVPSSAADASAWRLDQSLDLPEGLSLSGAFRSRFENARNSVRSGTPNDQVLTFRTRIDARYKENGRVWQFEVMDARQQYADADGILGTGDVNALDIQQASVKLALGSEATTLKLGRFTSDYGSRRLVARPIYRNTFNAFDGLEFTHTAPNGNQVAVLATQPVQRLPTDKASVLDNDFEWDKSSNNRRFYGVFTTQPAPLAGKTGGYFDRLRTEAYYFSLREKSDTILDSSINTLGLRAEVRAQPGQFDFEVEGILQRGDNTRITADGNVSRGDHRAEYAFFELGYSFAVPSRLRVLFEIDYGSGNDLETPQRQERFNQLFGVTAFAYGPTGFYGVFNASNIITPGLRASFNPIAGLNLMASYRHFWLADRRDSLGRTKQSDPSGLTDSYMGQHLDLRARWDVSPLSIRIEVGAVIYKPKGFQERNSVFTYGGAELTF